MVKHSSLIGSPVGDEENKIYGTDTKFSDVVSSPSLKLKL